MEGETPYITAIIKSLQPGLQTLALLVEHDGYSAKNNGNQDAAASGDEMEIYEELESTAVESEGYRIAFALDQQSILKHSGSLQNLALHDGFSPLAERDKDFALELDMADAFGSSQTIPALEYVIVGTQTRKEEHSFAIKWSEAEEIKEGNPIWIAEINHVHVPDLICRLKDPVPFVLYDATFTPTYNLKIMPYFC
ncbi:hypothetical protein ABW20_dc0106514 [Dactylellina cionopaga]|nr:hypothetical protein ABW20_dc0106514 [Dactylellina cionopaga]